MPARSSWAFRRRQWPHHTVEYIVSSLTLGINTRTLPGVPSTSSFLGAEVLLEQHLRDVERWARPLGEACDLPPPIIDDLALAGRLHDLGKVDPRFQSMLRQGAVVAGPQPLAKSLVRADDYRARRGAEAAAGYPRGTRHELATVALVEHDLQLRDQAHDWDLVLHLIASHHGYARLFVPVSFDDDPQQLRADVDGRVLEASSDHGLLRLADHRASEVSEERPE